VDRRPDARHGRRNGHCCVSEGCGFRRGRRRVTYTNSPVHTDDFYADRVAELEGCDDVDSIYVKDPAGLLTPERLATLVPHMQARLERLCIDEVHSHCNTGLAPITLLRAADLGMTKLHCALPPLANGSSHPSALQLVKNLHARGHRTDVDVEAMHAASDALTREARRRALPAGVPFEYDEAYYQHTIPGGVVSTLRRHLDELGRPELLPAVIEEAVHVRRDLGWPIVMTPFAQYIVTQATLNVMSGDRYSRLTDEIVDLLAGAFGPMPGEVDQDLLDRAMAQRTGALDDPDELTRADLRRRHGSHISDEELLLRAVMPSGQVDAMLEGPSGERAALQRLVEQLEGASGPISMSVSTGGAHLSISTGWKQDGTP
jgi:oxaloacetate decarboxylase alpha subunit